MDGPIWRLRAPRRRDTKPRHVRLPIQEQQTVKGGGAGRVPRSGGAAAPGGAAAGRARGPRALRYICRTYRATPESRPPFGHPAALPPFQAEELRPR
ncbi:hypothetical protein HPG69_008642 [Diceros bicornis minor]|uniref:Uncharacterized protein n=1 Tax=Diceros bicornis minor TaxID=77932 RepID=A0A7J7FAP7_DICBM|nr:hypothetical protein HPG69_008642 [Diceros bicornis minor]